jgi:hypothetical protein
VDVICVLFLRIIGSITFICDMGIVIIVAWQVRTRQDSQTMDAN